MQYTETVAASEDKTHIVVLEIPYVFGAVPGKIPLWKPLINYIKKSPIVFYTKGGTNIVSVEQVAAATFGVIENVNQHDCIVLGNSNVTWKQLIGMISKALGKKRIVVSIPTLIVKVVACIAKHYFGIRKKQTGLDVSHFIHI